MTDESKAAILERDVLIIGTGPAGSAAALALTQNGIKPMIVNQFGWTCRTPRAHITNPRTMEVLEDLGVMLEVRRHAVPHTLMGENTYCTSLAGKEFGRLRTWGTAPDRAYNYAMGSPEDNCDVTQNLMEPILLGQAAHQGAEVLFHTRFLEYVQDEDGVTVLLENTLSGHRTQVRCKYLIGADGANSRVAEQAGLPFEGQMGKSGSINIVFDADLTRYVAHRPSVLYWIIKTGSSVGGLGIGTVRMVRPWDRWLSIWGYDLEKGPPELDEKGAKDIVYGLIGDDSIEVKIDHISYWTVNELYATRLSEGRVFCMGDAVHRHPPTKGLGSNTSIQDAYNLAWKLALVLKKIAGPGLLDSYNAERVPVAKQIVKGANRAVTYFPPILHALGLLDTSDPAQMDKNIAAIEDPDQVDRRKLLLEAMRASQDVYDNPGIEMNQRYDSSAVVKLDAPMPDYKSDPEVNYEPTSYPGARLPHAWLARDEQRVSSLYICGRGEFTLLTGISGGHWRAAAKQVSDELGVPIRVHVIGPGQEYEDVYGDFDRVRETQESGAILVRPDVYVGWRADEYTPVARAELGDAMRQILSL